MPDFAVTTAFRATDRMSPAFRRMGAEADRFGQRGAMAMGRVGRAAQTARGFIMSMVPLAGGFALVGLASRAVELASSLNEVQNVVDVTFRQNAGQINAWAQNAITQFGLSELQAKQFTSQIGAMMKSSGIAGQELVNMSQGLAGLAGDFASFYNLDISDAFDKIRAGIAGETEPLRRLGINMTVANLQAFALSRGIRTQWQNMTQAQQTQLRYAFLMQASADAQGDFNRTLQTSFANQKRVLGVQFDQFLARIATAILPALTQAFRGLNDIMSRLPAEQIGAALGVIVSFLPEIIYGFAAWKGIMFAMKLGSWIEYLWMMRRAIVGATTATKAATIAQWKMNLAMFANPIGLIILAVVALGLQIYELYRQAERMWPQFLQGLDMIKNGFTTAADWIRNSFSSAIEWISNRFAALVNYISANLGRLGAAILDFIPGGSLLNIQGNNLQTPNAGRQQGTTFDGILQVMGAPSGSTVQGQTRGAGTFDVSLMGAN